MRGGCCPARSMGTLGFVQATGFTRLLACCEAPAGPLAVSIGRPPAAQREKTVNYVYYEASERMC